MQKHSAETKLTKPISKDKKSNRIRLFSSSLKDQVRKYYICSKMIVKQTILSKTHRQKVLKRTDSDDQPDAENMLNKKQKSPSRIKKEKNCLV